MGPMNESTQIALIMIMECYTNPIPSHKEGTQITQQQLVIRASNMERKSEKYHQKIELGDAVISHKIYQKKTIPLVKM